MEFKKPGKASSSAPSGKMSLSEMFGDEEEVQGEEVVEEEAGEDIGFFTVQEAMKKLQEAGFQLTPPEGFDGEEELGEDEFGEAVPPSETLGVN